MPKRLLHVDGTLHLASPETPVGYAALSYSWGSSGQPVTTRENIAKRYQSLDILGLPQTLRDAVSVTRALDLCYLWIDSICIVQDDEDKWVTEASKMADVNTNAYVVLAATRVRDATEGLLQFRTARGKTVSKISKGCPFTVQARLLGNHHRVTPDRDALARQPLSNRGWALRERLFAQRTIHFLRDKYCSNVDQAWYVSVGGCCKTARTRSNGHPQKWKPEISAESSLLIG